MTRKIANGLLQSRASDLSIPDFLRIPADERAAAWAASPPIPMPFIQSERRRSLEPDAAAFLVQEEERRRLKSLAKISKMKAKMETKKLNVDVMRWDARKGRFVEDPLRYLANHGGKATKVETRRDLQHQLHRATVRKQQADKAAVTEYWSRVNKDTARALAELNGVWADKYEKLKDGLLVMTVTNRLKGIEKKGGTVKWN